VRAARIVAPGQIEITTVDDPVPGPIDVVVEVAAVGLCGTDLHILAGEHGRLPVIPGHEIAGTVVAVGADVVGVRVGDAVAVDPSLPCESCRMCRRGRQNLCDTLGALGVTVDGGAAELVRARANRCVVLTDGVDLHGAALIEPLSCAVRGYDVLRQHLGSSVLVYGAGTMGLLMLELARRTGAVAVDVVEPNDERRAAAEAIGCSRAAADGESLDGEWDVVIDATGSAEAIRDGLTRVARGGTFLQFGVASPEARVEIAPYTIYNSEITITGSMAVLHSFERAAEMFAAGFVDWHRIVTDQVPLDDYASALDAFARARASRPRSSPAEGQRQPSASRSTSRFSRMTDT
jgi:2-desacetyl-2-hydroxyethyl bacteriochlorophyllide A dehydrogenase